MKVTPTIYIVEGSGCNIKPMLVARELGLDCIVKKVDVDPPNKKRLNYVNIQPFLMLPDGTNLREANAISWYLAEGSSLIPESAFERAQAIRWINFEQSSIETYFSPLLVSNHKIKTVFPADGVSTSRTSSTSALLSLNGYLANRKYLVDGGFSIADITVFGYMYLAFTWGYNMKKYREIYCWMERILERRSCNNLSELVNGVRCSY